MAEGEPRADPDDQSGETERHVTRRRGMHGEICQLDVESGAGRERGTACEQKRRARFGADLADRRKLRRRHRYRPDLFDCHRHLFERSRPRLPHCEIRPVVRELKRYLHRRIA